jgi:hypothetical protein
MKNLSRASPHLVRQSAARRSDVEIAGAIAGRDDPIGGWTAGWLAGSVAMLIVGRRLGHGAPAGRANVK